MSNTPNPAPAPDTPLIIERHNVLREKVGGALDPSLINKADSAISSLSGNFQQWLEETVERMATTYRELNKAPLTQTNRNPLYTSVLEVKSLGDTYGYPLITRFAQSLCRLLICLPSNTPAPPLLVEGHIDAIRAALRSDMRGPLDAIGTKLALELETQVDAFLKGRAA